MTLLANSSFLISCSVEKKPAVSLLKITIIVHAGGSRLGLKEVDHEIMTLTVAEPQPRIELSSSTISQQRGRLGACTITTHVNMVRFKQR